VGLICERDAKWSDPVRECLREAGIRIVQTPYRAPNANAYAERFVRSIKKNASTGLCVWASAIFARHQFVEHSHLERNHQGLGNTLIVGRPARTTGSIRRRPLLGGLLNYYERAA